MINPPNRRMIGAPKEWPKPSHMEDPLVTIVTSGDIQEARTFFENRFWRNSIISPDWQYLRIALVREDKPMMRLLLTWGATATSENMAEFATSDKYAHYLKLLRQCGARISVVPPSSPPPPPPPPKDRASELLVKLHRIVDQIKGDLRALHEIEKAKKAGHQVGDKMPDGAIYAGISPTTHQPLFTTPHNASFKGTFNMAAAYAFELDAHGHHDWRMPTKEELDMLIKNRDKGALAKTFSETDCYWSSTETSVLHAYNQNPKSGRQFNDLKGYRAYIRPVRA